MKKDMISVIIPIYNAEKYLKRCIESILNQTYKNLEILLINDGSTDKSKDICNEYKEKDSRIKIINKENEGVSKTRNIGLNLAIGEYIFFMDSDDFLDKTAMEIMYNEASKYKIIKLNYKVMKNNREKDRTRYCGIFSREQLLKEIISGKIGGFCWGYLIKRELIQNINFNENTSHMEDTIFIIQLLKNVDYIKMIDNSYYYYCINTSSLTSVKSTNILKTIEEYLYSINAIQEYINKNFRHNYREDILDKKTIILEKEISKIQNKKQFNQIVNSEEIRKELKCIIDNRKGIGVFYARIIVNRRYFIYKIYILARRLLKCIKNYII